MAALAARRNWSRSSGLPSLSASSTITSSNRTQAAAWPPISVSGRTATPGPRRLATNPKVRPEASMPETTIRSAVSASLTKSAVPVSRQLPSGSRSARSAGVQSAASLAFHSAVVAAQRPAARSGSHRCRAASPPSM